MKIKEIFLANRPEHAPTAADFGTREIDCPCALQDGGFSNESLPQGGLLVKLAWISVDPYMRNRMRPVGPSYAAAWEIGGTIDGFAVGQVIQSRSGKFPNGTFVSGMMPWAEYVILDDSKPSPQGPTEIPKIEGLAGKENHFVGLFGVTGLTASIGMHVHGNLKEGQTVLVSGAAGATGSVAGQYALRKGAKNLIGICGTDTKCQYLRKCGFTHTINYKTEDVAAKVAEYSAETGIDCYFDNVGGEISEIVITRMNKDSHVVLCGQISTYNDPDAPYPNVLSEEVQKYVDTNNITRKRFLLLDHIEHTQHCIGELIGWFLQGKIVAEETVVDGFENAPKAFCDMLAGKNIGKMVVRV